MCIIKIAIHGIKEITYCSTEIKSKGVDDPRLLRRDNLKDEMERLIGGAWIEYPGRAEP